jgi:hypothetical protein
MFFTKTKNVEVTADGFKVVFPLIAASDISGQGSFEIKKA